MKASYLCAEVICVHLCPSLVGISGSSDRSARTNGDVHDPCSSVSICG
jgi:hypothetical protein